MKGIRKKSVFLASSGVNLHEVVEDTKALSRLWDMYEGLLKKHRLVNSAIEMPSSFNSI